jgi:hypothetical protein
VGVTSELLNLAGEYAVASQLTRRGHYAQLTFGNRKRTDILVDSAGGSLFRVEVKAKQGKEWLRVHAPRAGDFVILVDFQNKARRQPPDFYILNFSDWKGLVTAYKTANPDIEIDADYCVAWPDGWKGLNLTAEWVKQYEGGWDKLPGSSGHGTDEPYALEASDQQPTH